MKGTWQTGDHTAGHLAVIAVIAAADPLSLPGHQPAPAPDLD
jgi:hypothetical protein